MVPVYVNNGNAKKTYRTAPVLSHLPPIIAALFYQINTPSIIYFFRSFHLGFDERKPATTTTMWKKKWKAEKQYRSEKHMKYLKNESNRWYSCRVVCRVCLVKARKMMIAIQTKLLFGVCIPNDAWARGCLCDYENGMPIETHHVCLCANSQHTHSQSRKTWSDCWISEWKTMERMKHFQFDTLVFC